MLAFGATVVATAYQEIATAYGLAMTVVVGSRFGFAGAKCVAFALYCGTAIAVPCDSVYDIPFHHAKSTVLSDGAS